METSRSSFRCNSVNNDIYDQLGDRWYTAQDDPVALLRAESKCRNPWILQTIQSHFKSSKIKVLDVGCGAGFLSNPLAQAGYDVTGVDLSHDSLEVARRYDATKSVRYLHANAYELPFETNQFDVVCAMDFLEHVEDPAKAILEMSRVLNPGGLFFFHTFNRNFISAFVVIKLVEWFVKNTPPQLHVSRLFIKPRELKEFCLKSNLDVMEIRGLQPVIFSLAVLRGFYTGVVEEGFRFKFGKSLLTSYCGFAKKSALVTIQPKLTESVLDQLC